MRTIFSILMWIYWTTCFFFFFLVVLLLFLFTSPFDRYRRIPNKALGGLAWAMIKINPGWKFTVRGADRNKVSEPTLVVANHQSFLDMPMTYLLPWNMKWVSKKSLFRIPVLGWIIAMTGHIAIDRRSRRSVKKLDKLVEPIKNGIPGMIFPEGTRTVDGSLKSFKNGAFVLSKEYNLKVLPIVLSGGYRAMTPGTWKFNPRQHFTISVLDPLNPEDFDDFRELRNKTRECIKKELDAIQDE